MDAARTPGPEIMENVPGAYARWHAFGLLLSFPAAVVCGVAAAQHYLGVPLDVLPIVAMSTSALFIYALNRFSDGEEDGQNQPQRAAALRLTAVVLAFSSLALFGLGLRLWQSGELRPLYLVLAIVLVGVAYSFPLLPAYRRARGWHRIRLKDVLLLKSAVVAAVWSSAFFVAPVLHLPAGWVVPSHYWLLGLGFFWAHLANVIFCDFRDQEGDRAAGVITLPVRFGVPRCYVGIAVTSGAWLLAGACWWLMGRIDAAHFSALLVGNGAYPLAVWWARERLKLGELAMDYVIESITFGYALALWLLA